MSTRTLFTVEQFEQLPEEEAVRFELDEGDLVEVAAATLAQNLVRDRIGRTLGTYIDEHRLGILIAEQEFRLSEKTVRRPDQAFIRQQNMGRVRCDKSIQEVMPDLAIEIASESDTYAGMMRKVKQYLSSGVQLVWVFNLALSEVQVFDNQGNTTIARSEDLLQ